MAEYANKKLTLEQRHIDTLEQLVEDKGGTVTVHYFVNEALDAYLNPTEPSWVGTERPD